MEITKDNFYDMQDIIIKDIENADFISFDLEMSGIGSRNNNIIDFPEERYLKYKNIAEKYKIIQVGICVFNRVEGDNQYIAKPYNFYVFPEENTGNNYINCEVGALIFNRDHNMDFNKWIYKGRLILNNYKVFLI
jgi:poly(A)-specific ribonuclease